MHRVLIAGSRDQPYQRPSLKVEKLRHYPCRGLYCMSSYWWPQGDCIVDLVMRYSFENLSCHWDNNY